MWYESVDPNRELLLVNRGHLKVHPFHEKPFFIILLLPFPTQEENGDLVGWLISTCGNELPCEPSPWVITCQPSRHGVHCAWIHPISGVILYVHCWSLWWNNYLSFLFTEWFWQWFIPNRSRWLVSTCGMILVWTPIGECLFTCQLRGARTFEGSILIN